MSGSKDPGEMEHTVDSRLTFKQHITALSLSQTSHITYITSKVAKHSGSEFEIVSPLKPAGLLSPHGLSIFNIQCNIVGRNLSNRNINVQLES